MEGKLAVPIAASYEADSLLLKIKTVITEGYEQHTMQKTPHPTLLDVSFYYQKLFPLLAQWLVVSLNYFNMKKV